jgi:hypothetical protein
LIFPAIKNRGSFHSYNGDYSWDINLVGGAISILKNDGVRQWER